jgi:hypothetical protein
LLDHAAKEKEQRLERFDLVFELGGFFERLGRLSTTQGRSTRPVARSKYSPASAPSRRRDRRAREQGIRQWYECPSDAGCLSWHRAKRRPRAKWTRDRQQN